MSPLQVFGSVLAPIDLGEYFFEVYATAQKPAFSGPVERALKKELEDFVGSGDYNSFLKKRKLPGMYGRKATLPATQFIPKTKT